MKTLESYREEIFRLYIVLDKTASEIIAILEGEYNFSVSPKVLKTKLGQWGYTKNVKRCEVVHILREKARRQAAGIEDDFTFTLQQRPIDLKRVERHRQRAGLPDIHQQSLPDSAQNVAAGIAWLTPVPPLATSLPEHWRVSEKLLYDIDILIKSSFETGLWSFNGNEHIIKSSTSQDFETEILHNFLGDFAIGCHAANTRNFVRAGDCWQRAFINIENLVRGNYHDIIPNLIQKINDLNHQGHSRLAALLKEHIARCGRSLLGPKTPAKSIFDGLGKLDMSFMPEIEERIMKQFTQLFELYLGHICYNSFVIMMDGARRRLLQYSWAPLDCLPDIFHLDTVFGPTDRRPLDVIGMRIEILSHRKMHVETEMEALMLIQRAEMIQNNNWKRFYNLTRGWYFLGTAQYFMRKREAAIESLSNALRSDDELCEVDGFHIFNAERMMILKYLEHLRRVDWAIEEIEGPDGGLNHSVGPLVFFRYCKEPRRPKLLNPKQVL